MKDMSTGNEAGTLILFSLPMLLGNVFQQLYNMVDSMVVGQFVGPTALAAVGASFPVLFLLVALFMGIGMGANVLIAQFFGAKDYKRVRRTIDTMYIVSFWGSLALGCIGFFAAEPIMRLMQAPADVLGEATTYLQILCLGMLPLFGYNTVSAILRGLGDAKTPLYMLIVSTILNIILDLVFVIAFRWGVAGVATATVISQTVSFVLAVLWLNKRHELLRTNFLKLEFDGPLLRSMLRIGLPSGVQQSLVALGMVAITGIVNSFGTIVAAGFAAANRIESLATLPAMSIGMAISTFTGQNLGAGKSERVHRGLLASLAMSGGFAIVAAVVLSFFGATMISWFNSDPGVIGAGAHYLQIVSPFFVVFAVMFMFNGVLRGAGESMIPLLSTLLAMWLVRMPLAFLFSSLWGVDGLWFSMPTGWFLGMGISIVYYATGRWKTAMARNHKFNPGLAPSPDQPLAAPTPEGD